MSEDQDLQSSLLNRFQREGKPIAVWLTSGKRLIGRIKGHDRFTILLDQGGTDQLVFKHAIATVGPPRDPS
jgi:host factor-I protein